MPAFQNYTPNPGGGGPMNGDGVGLQNMPKRAVGLRSIPQGGGLGMGGSNNMRGMSNFGMANSTAPQRLYGNQTGFAQAAAAGPRVANYQPQPGFGYQGPNAVQANQGGPSAAQIQAEMQRRGVGAQLGPRNAALAGYMMAPNNPMGGGGAPQQMPRQQAPQPAPQQFGQSSVPTGNGINSGPVPGQAENMAAREQAFRGR